MKTTFFSHSRIIILSIALISIFACTKKPESIGLDLVDANKPVTGKDTIFDVTAYSVLDTAIGSAQTSLNMLGSMTTQSFGMTTASFYTQLRLSDTYPPFGPNPVADSAVLTLVLSGFYGNVNTQQAVRIYKVNEDILRDSSYLSNTILGIDGTELANYSFVPDTNQIQIVDTTGGANDTSYMAAVVRIPLNSIFTNEIFGLDDSTFASSDEFVSVFKGLYIKPDNITSYGEGAILYFNLLDSRSNLTLYYKNDTAETKSFKFIFNTNNARLGQYKHDYSKSTDQNFKSQLGINSVPDTTLGAQQIYIQGLGGIKTLVHLKGFDTWMEGGHKIINQAKLYLTSKDYNEGFEPPAKLLMFTYNKDGDLATFSDQQQTENYFGGVYDSDTKSYWFRVTMFAQGLYNGDPDYGLVVYPNAKAIRADEVVFYGSDPSIPGHIRVEVIYTDVE